MAYTINRTNGSILATVADGTIDTSTADLTFVGRNYDGYGEILNENYVKLLENFANTTAPANPITGQCWWDSSAGLLKVYAGTGYKVISSSTAAAAEPANSVTGDMWWDTVNEQLFVYNGASYSLIGPAFSAGSGKSGTLVETVTDNAAGDHVVVKVYASDDLIAIISNDAEFTPQVAITGFATIKPGYNLSTTLAGVKYHGTATNSDALGGIAAANYLRSNANEVTSGTLAIQHDTGLTVGVDGDFKVSVSGSDVDVVNQTLNGDLHLKVNDGGVITTLVTLDGATSAVLLNADPTSALGAATKGYVDTTIASDAILRTGATQTHTTTIRPTVTNTYSLGAASFKYLEVFATTFTGTATSAQYADLAERYEADAVYAPGTLVTLGGAKEVTLEVHDACDDVFGVVSTDPAYLMNSAAGDNDTHPAIAIAGRVPVRVIGLVSKGDRLVSAGNGVARVGSAAELTMFNVIGRALEDKENAAEQLIEVAVTAR